jgi:hypothetical protein
LPDSTPGRLNPANLLARMAVGAVASKVGGGKAENGALSAAFEYLFNDLNFFNSVDHTGPFRSEADRLIKQGFNSSEYNIYGHGNVYYVQDALSREITPEQLADRVRNDPTWSPGKPVRMWNCLVGSSNAVGKNFPQELANALNTRVTATTDYVVYTFDGKTSPGAFLTYGTGANKTYTSIPNPFAWRTFSPNAGKY